MFEAGPVELTVYNILGQRVTTLVEGVLPAGTHAFVWDGMDGAGVPMASGLYLYRARVSSTVQTRTMALIK